MNKLHNNTKHDRLFRTLDIGKTVHKTKTFKSTAEEKKMA